MTIVHDTPLKSSNAAGQAVSKYVFSRAWWLDKGERVLCVCMFARLVFLIAPSLTSRPTNALLLVSEGLVVLFILLRRRAVAVTSRRIDWVAAFVGTVAPLLALAGGTSLAPMNVGAALLAFGLLFVIWAKLTLRLSFGLAAANRGVVERGPYKFVRHPMYFGYLVVYVGFFLMNPLAWNAGIYLVTAAALAVRILAEERVLVRDERYREFMGRVRFRLVPGLF